MAALAEAFVRIRPDTRGFRDEVRRDAETAGSESGDAFADRFTRDASGRLRDERGRFVTEGRSLGEGAGDGFNNEFGRRTQDAPARLRSLRPRFTAEGRNLGSGAGGGFTGGFRRSAKADPGLGAARVRVTLEGRRLGEHAGNAFTAGFRSRLGGLGGVVRQVFGLIVSRLGALARGFGGVLRAAGALGTAGRRALGALAGGIGTAVRAFTGLAGVAGRAISLITSRLGALAVGGFSAVTRAVGALGTLAGRVFGALTNAVSAVTRGLGALGAAAGRAFGLIISRLGALVRGFAAAARAVAGLLATLSKIAVAAAAMSTLAASAAAVSASLVGLVAALAPAAGIIAALPGAVALVAATMGVLKVALIGVGDAFKAALGDDEEAFEKALEKLSPAAQAVARELRGLKPALDGVRTSVQDALFAPLIGQLTRLADALLPALTDGMTAVAGALGQLGVRIVDFATSAESVAAVRSVFASLLATIQALTPAVVPLLSGLRDLAVVGAQFIAGFAPGLADLATRFGNFLSAASASGQALGWMTGAVAVLRQLGAIAADVVGILAGIGRAAQTASGDALGAFGQLLDAMHAFVDSAEGQRVLVEIFTALRAITAALVPVLQAALAGVAALAPVVASLATAFLPILTDAITAIVPA
ncbi:hypothetical protein ABT338_20020, partial [Streptosporangium saharense]